MSQSELAKVVGVSKQTIFVMEKNNYSPSLLLAYRIANFFEVSIEEIFAYKEGGPHND
nr:helix-turn-helix transcriptional regulator [Paenibacillus sp. YPG26]